MFRLFHHNALSNRLAIVLVFLLLSLFFGTVLFSGCSNLSAKKKDESSIPDKLMADMENGRSMLIGDYTNIGNLHTVEIRGVGLVHGLAGTGSDDINSLERKMVYDDMTKLGVRDVRAILADPSTAVVNILGHLRPGIQEGDLFDVEVSLPYESDAKSLRGGWLMKASLKEMLILDGDLRDSGTLAYVEGPILVDPLASETADPTGLKKGYILSGARAKATREIFLTMKAGNESAFFTDRIAKEINNRFYISTGQKKGMATPKSDSLIVLDVHPSYRNNVARYVKVVQSIACYENQQKQFRRLERLKAELLIPDRAQNAAFQLEAIGKAGIAPLREAIKNDNPEIRFYSACSLAFLGDGSGARVLADLARDEPAFRVYALSALSVLRNDIEAEVCLRELLHVPSAETRYGAFRALWSRNPYDRTVRGESLQNERGEQFSYHGVTSDAPPMVHVTKSKRPEIVLFGNDIRVNKPFALSAGPRIFVNGQSSEGVIVSRFAVKGLDEKRTVTDKLDDIIRAIVDLGGTYPDVIQMLCEADRDKVLSCRLEIDCLPEPFRVYRRPGGNALDGADEDEEESKKPSIWNRMNPKTWFESNPRGKTSDDSGTMNLSGRE